MKQGSLKTQSQALKFLNMDAGKRQNLSDSQVRGLQLERLRVGVGKWRIRTSSADGRDRICMTLGDAPNLTLADARITAQKITRSIAMGENPKMRRQEGKQIPTISEFIQERYIPFVAGYKRSWECDRGLLKNHIETRWGKRYLDQITKADLITLFTEHRKTHAPGSCNRLLILLRYMFNLAIKWETPGISKNPTTGFPLMPEDNQKERFLTTEEAQVLYANLKRSDNAMLKYIVPMLIWTGARKREVLDARWQDFDIERRSWRIHTTKLGRPRHVPLSDGAVNLLNSMPRIANCEWAFANPKTQRPYVSIYCAWNKARNQASLQNFRMHDLRHSFASFLVNAGRTLYEVQHLLGHTQIKTTARYSHLTKDTLLDATNSVNKALGGMFMPMVLPIPAAQVQLLGS